MKLLSSLFGCVAIAVAPWLCAVAFMAALSAPIIAVRWAVTGDNPFAVEDTGPALPECPGPPFTC